MKIKNFKRFVNENLESPHSPISSTITPEARYGEPTFFDKDEFSEEEWKPTGDKPRKQKPDTSLDFHPGNYASGEEFEYDDYYPEEEEEDEDFEEDELDPRGPDEEPFISDTDDDTENSDSDYIY